MKITAEPSWLEKIQKSVRRIFQAVTFFQTPVDKSGKLRSFCIFCTLVDEGNGNYIAVFCFTEAARVRKEYDESSAKLSKLQSRISSLKQKLKHDFGRSAIKIPNTG